MPKPAELLLLDIELNECRLSEESVPSAVSIKKHFCVMGKVSGALRQEVPPSPNPITLWQITLQLGQDAAEGRSNVIKHKWDRAPDAE